MDSIVEKTEALLSALYLIEGTNIGALDAVRDEIEKEFLKVMRPNEGDDMECDDDSGDAVYGGVDFSHMHPTNSECLLHFTSRYGLDAISRKACVMDSFSHQDSLRNPQGRDPVHEIIQCNSNCEVIASLLREYATLGLDIAYSNEYLQTLLHRACSEQKIEIIKAYALLKDVIIDEDMNGDTPLMIAVKTGLTSIDAHLALAKMGFDIYAIGSRKCNIFHIESETNDSSVKDAAQSAKKAQVMLSMDTAKQNAMECFNENSGEQTFAVGICCEILNREDDKIVACRRSDWKNHFRKTILSGSCNSTDNTYVAQIMTQLIPSDPFGRDFPDMIYLAFVPNESKSDLPPVIARIPYRNAVLHHAGDEISPESIAPVVVATKETNCKFLFKPFIATHEIPISARDGQTETEKIVLKSVIETVKEELKTQKAKEDEEYAKSLIAKQKEAQAQLQSILNIEKSRITTATAIWPHMTIPMVYIKPLTGQST